MINKNPLSGFPVKTPVEGWVCIQHTVVRDAVNKNKYLLWSGFDITGTSVTGTLFETPGFPLVDFAPNTVVHVIGGIGESKSGMQVWATHLAPVTVLEEAEEFKSLCMPSVPAADLEVYINSLHGYSTKLRDPELLKLSAAMWAIWAPYLKITPAARKNHEPLRGGLAKHTWEVISLLNNQVLFSQGLDMDVMLFSALYHDFGKIYEYTGDMNWAPEGRLVSHGVMTLEAIARLDSQFAVPKKTMMHIRHCILSHHGKFGEVKPVTREALAVHFADYMMSQLGHMTEVMKAGVGNDGWAPTYSPVLEGTAYIPQLDNREYHA